MSTDNLLVELFVEELPPKALQKLGDAFAQELAAQLRAQPILWLKLPQGALSTATFVMAA